MTLVSHAQPGLGANVELALFLAAALLACAWSIGSVRMARRGGPAGARHRTRATFAGVLGWSLLLASVAPPLDRLGSQLLSAHMVQHELLIVGAVPLLVAARPLAALLWGLPERLRTKLGALLRTRLVRRAASVATQPVLATVAHAVVIWAWHLPAAYDGAVARPELHLLQHASFGVTAAMFWWAVLARHPSGATKPVAPLLVLATMIHTTLLGAGIALAPEVVYDSYLVAPVARGFDPLVDQQLAGLVMWVPGGLAYLGAGLLLVARCLDAGSSQRPRAGMAVGVLALAAIASGCGSNGHADASGASSESDAEVIGAGVFAQRCATCHAIGGTGNPAAPDLRRSAVAGRVERVERVVRHGQGAMPSFGDELDDEEIAGVAAYVSSEVAGRIDLDERHDLPANPDI